MSRRTAPSRSQVCLSPLVAVVALACLGQARAAHIHTFAGLIDTNADTVRDTLSFVGSTTGATVTTLSTIDLQLATVGIYAGYFIQADTGVTWTALQRSNLVWGDTGYLTARAWGATPGALIELRIDSVSSLAGGTFSFWESGAALPTYTASPGLTGGTFAFPLTDAAALIGDGVNDGNGEPPTTTNGSPVPTDPYGHIHGRQFTVDQPGTYSVTYVLHDRNGLVPDSAPFTVNYLAVPEPGVPALLAGTTLLVVFIRRRAARGK